MRTWIAAGALIGASLEALMAGGAAAQKFEGPPPQTQANVPMVAVAVSVTHDTNVAKSGAALAALRGLKPDDWYYAPTVTLNLRRPIGREDIFLTGIAGYDFYQHNSVLNRENLDLNGGGDVRVGPCTATLSDNFNRHQSYLQDVLLPATANIKNTETIDTLELDAGCVRTVGIGPKVSVAQSWDSNSSFKTFDYNQTTVTASLVYQQPSIGQLSLFGQYDTATYPNELVLLSSGSLEHDHYQLWAGGARFSRGLGKIGLTASAAYTSLTPLGAGSFSGFTYNADVTWRVIEPLQLHFAGERAAKPAILAGGVYMVDDSYRAEAVYGLPGLRLTLTAGASEERRRYGGVALVPAPFLNENDRLDDLYASARYAFARRFFALVDLRHETRRGDVAELNYNSTRVGITVGAQF